LLNRAIPANEKAVRNDGFFFVVEIHHLERENSMFKYIIFTMNPKAGNN